MSIASYKSRLEYTHNIDQWLRGSQPFSDWSNRMAGIAAVQVGGAELPTDLGS
jgi:hypothetical protein